MQWCDRKNSIGFGVVETWISNPNIIKISFNFSLRKFTWNSELKITALYICLACCDSWSRKESDTTERLNWTELNICRLGEKVYSPSVQFSHSVESDSAAPWTAACQASLSITNSQTCSNSCPSSWWCHPTISSSVVPFSSHLKSFTASGPFPVSQFFSSGGPSIGVPAV